MQIETIQYHDELISAKTGYNEIEMSYFYLVDFRNERIIGMGNTNEDAKRDTFIQLDRAERAFA